MVLLTACCFCIPLKIGCYLIAAYFIFCYISELIDYKQILDHLGPEGNEDEENRRQKSNVRILSIIHALLAVVVIIVSIVVVYATSQKIIIILKSAGCFIAGLETFKFFAYVLIFSGASIQWLSEIFRLVLRLYFAAVWYSYGEYIEEKEQIISYITVYDNTSDQQIQHAITANVSQTGQPYQREPFPTSYQPYGGRYDGQGAATYPPGQYPYHVQGGQNPYFMPGPQSNQSMGGGQRPPVQPQAPYSTQRQRDPPSSTPMPGPQSGQSMGGSQRPPVQPQVPYSTQRQRDPPSSTPMPGPQSGQSMGGSQRPPVQPQAPYSTQRQRDPPSSTPMPGPQSGQSMGGAQRPPVQPQAPYSTQRQRDPPSSTPKPMPYEPSSRSKN